MLRKWDRSLIVVNYPVDRVTLLLTSIVHANDTEKYADYKSTEYILSRKTGGSLY